MKEPPPATVPQAHWRDIEVPPLGELQAQARVSVVVDGDPDAAAPTLAALGGQSYPDALVEVIGPDADREPDGEVVVFLAAGTKPAAAFVEAHARWHHAVADAVVFGPLGAPGDPDDPLGLTVDMTRDLTDLAGGYHLGAAEGTLSLRRDLYIEAGGPGATAPGAARIDLAQRLHCAGAVFIADPEAAADGQAVELARAVADACRTGETLELRLPEVAALVALPPFRGIAPARRHARPAVTVNLDAADAPPADARATLAGALAGRLGDIEVRVQAPEGSPAREALASVVAADARALFAGSSLDEPCESPFQITVPPAAHLDPRTLADLHELALAEEAGALHVTVPGATPQEAMIEVVATAAWRRARRLAAASGEQVEAIIGRLLGERWMSGVEVSTRRHGVDEPQVTEHGPLAPATDLDHERRAHLRFRDRADEGAERSASLARRALAERLRARDVRQAAERVEARLAQRERRA